MAQDCTKTPETATYSPREYVAAMIDHLAAKGWQGEHILQMIEKRILALSVKDKRLVFYHSGLVSDEEAVSDRTFGSKEDMQTEVQGEMVKLVMQGLNRKAA